MGIGAGDEDIEGEVVPIFWQLKGRGRGSLEK